MKILVVGDWHSELHEEAIYQAFNKLNHEVFRFSWHEYFIPVLPIPLKAAEIIYKKFQNKYLMGPLIHKINQDFMNMARILQPDFIFIYRGTHILFSSLQKVKQTMPNIVLVGYNNDDPFSNDYPKYIWRHFITSIPVYDLVLAYRKNNIKDLKKAGARHVDLLKPWYIPERNHPLDLSDEEMKRYGCDVIFIGHYEEDGRKQSLEKIVRKGFNLKLYGPGFIKWDYAIRNSPELSSFIPLQLVWGEEYNKAINGAKVALCFLSKLNRDTYTRRCFEIPASGTMLLSEYTEDLADMFREGVEADFFRSEEELIDKLRKYVDNDSLRKRIASAGRQRIVADGHDVYSRAKYIVKLVIS